MGDLVLRRAGWHELDPRSAYRILRLRAEVFVVEQRCAYGDLDGRDLEPDTEHLWWDGDAGPVDAGPAGPVGPGGAGPVAAYLRVLRDGTGTAWIGRVCTRSDARGRGLAAGLVDDVVARLGHHELALNAQVYLEPWYARWGFTADGPRFDEDGIPHLPMRRPGRPIVPAGPGSVDPAGTGAVETGGAAGAAGSTPVTSGIATSASWTEE